MLKFAEANEKISENVVETYKKIESGVVGGYTNMQDSIVNGAKNIMDKSMMALFAKEGETVEETKERLQKKLIVGLDSCVQVFCYMKK